MRENEGMNENPYQSPIASEAGSAKEVNPQLTPRDLIFLVAAMVLLNLAMRYMTIDGIWYYPVAMGVFLGAVFAKRLIAARRARPRS